MSLAPKRCQGFNASRKRCRNRLKDDKTLYCCPGHRPKNVDEIMVACSICMEPVDQKKDSMRTLRCGHSHHRPCLQLWIEMTRDNRPSCPLCRTPIPLSGQPTGTGTGTGAGTGAGTVGTNISG